jgi:hypothetical protein
MSYQLPWRREPTTREYVDYFRVKANGIGIVELSTRRFFIEGDYLIEEVLPLEGGWVRARRWKLDEVEILLPKEADVVADMWSKVMDNVEAK